MNEKERKAVKELIASGIACIIDIGRAIKAGSGLDIRAEAISHADTFMEQIDVLTNEDGRR